MKAVNRGRLAKRLYREHGSLTEVGKILGVSAGRVKQLMVRADRYDMRPSWLEGLDDRLAYILVRNGLTNVEQVCAVLERIENCPEIGPIRCAMLRAWLAASAGSASVAGHSTVSRLGASASQAVQGLGGVNDVDALVAAQGQQMPTVA